MRENNDIATYMYQDYATMNMFVIVKYLIKEVGNNVDRTCVPVDV